MCVDFRLFTFQIINPSIKKKKRVKNNFHKMASPATPHKELSDVSTRISFESMPWNKETWQVIKIIKDNSALMFQKIKQKNQLIKQLHTQNAKLECQQQSTNRVLNSMKLEARESENTAALKVNRLAAEYAKKLQDITAMNSKLRKGFKTLQSRWSELNAKCDAAVAKCQFAEAQEKQIRAKLGQAMNKEKVRT